MPKVRGARICPKHGCPNDMPCEEHQRKAWEGSTRADRLPSNWDSIRRFVLRRDNYECQWPGCRATATEVDHVIPNDDHSPANLQSLCKPHHQRKTLAEAQAARRGNA